MNQFCSELYDLIPAFSFFLLSKCIHFSYLLLNQFFHFFDPLISELNKALTHSLYIFLKSCFYLLKKVVSFCCCFCLVGVFLPEARSSLQTGLYHSHRWAPVPCVSISCASESTEHCGAGDEPELWGVAAAAGRGPECNAWTWQMQVLGGCLCKHPPAEAMTCLTSQATSLQQLSFIFPTSAQ